MELLVSEGEVLCECGAVRWEGDSYIEFSVMR